MLTPKSNLDEEINRPHRYRRRGRSNIDSGSDLTRSSVSSGPVRDAFYDLRLCTPPLRCLQPSAEPLPKVVKDIAGILSKGLHHGSIPTVFKVRKSLPLAPAPMVSYWKVPLVAILGLSNQVSPHPFKVCRFDHLSSMVVH